jgi:hypothetical protein
MYGLRTLHKPIVYDNEPLTFSYNKLCEIATEEENTKRDKYSSQNQKIERQNETRYRQI